MVIVHDSIYNLESIRFNSCLKAIQTVTKYAEDCVSWIS